MSKSEFITVLMQSVRMLCIFMLLFFAGFQKTSSYFSSNEQSANTMTSGVFPAPALRVLGLAAPALTIQEDGVLLEFFAAENNKAVAFILSGEKLKEYTKADYVISYESNGVLQGIKGSIPINDAAEASEPLILGTCSADDSCTYHEGITFVSLEITLTGPEKSLTLTKTLHL